MRKIYNDIRTDGGYQSYMERPESSFKEDQKMLVYIVKEFISDCQSLKNIYEEYNIFWEEDYYAVNMMLIEFIEAIRVNDDEFQKLPPVFKDVDENGKSEDKQFAVDLFRKTVAQENKYEDVIAARAKNWEFERIAKIDVILLKMAIAELLNFYSIPVKVTMNEYIEISKYYSTPKSRVFINGILDKLIAEFKENNEINKSGRGLIDN